jgi:hypothetical protein
MRSSRATWFHLDSAGLELTTVGAGGRFQKKVEVPYSWVRGFLQVQAAATLPGTRLKVKPVDLLSVIRFLRYSKPKMSPRALRFEFQPGEPAVIVLEPWEKSFPLRDTEHHYDAPKKTRLWGRSRLKLLEPVLPFTEEAEVFIKGRGLPSFYVLKLPGMEFTLGLSGRSGARWDSGSGFDLSEESRASEEKIGEALALLSHGARTTTGELAENLGVTLAESSDLLAGLCRRGLSFYRPTHGEFRHRELFSEPLDLTRVYPPDPRLQKASEMVRRNSVDLKLCQPRETRKIKRLPTPEGKVAREIVYRDWCFEGTVDGLESVEVVLNEADRVIFGRCSCSHFQQNLLTEGPCEHMLALRSVGLDQREELPTSSKIHETEEEER